MKRQMPKEQNQNSSATLEQKIASHQLQNIILESGKYLKGEKLSYGERLLISFCTIWHGLYLFSNGFVLFFGKLYCEFSNYEAEIPFFTMLYVIVFKNGCELLC